MHFLLLICGGRSAVQPVNQNPRNNYHPQESNSIETDDNMEELRFGLDDWDQWVSED